MSLYWQMEQEDKPVYMEGDNKGGKMATVPKKADEELWYLRIVRNFALSRDEDLSAQPPTCAAKAQLSKVKNVKGEKKGMRHSSDSGCDYVVVSDLLEGLAPVVVKKQKAEPRDTADIPASNPEDPIDLESSPEPLVKTKAGKRKHVKVEAEAQPAKKIPRKKISKRGNLDAFIPVSPAHTEPSSAVNDDLPPFPPHALISEQLESTKAVENEVEKIAEAENPEVEKPVEVELEKVVDPKTADVDATRPKSPEVVARDPEKGKAVPEDPVITIPASSMTSAPVNVERNPAGDQGSFAHVDENSPIHPYETPRDNCYRCYSEKKADEIHASVWKLKKDDTFSDWRVCVTGCKEPFLLGRSNFKRDVLTSRFIMLILKKLLPMRPLRIV
ncbi:hypothetical protein HanOQP8_Chr17g0666911 [Helianthus annuus]|nr:hypothetical protein HanIR_Chr17g0880991 [Helianthus annuus]KAJ0636858.1 hypothetical protein HanOQP8_Chr17g0666911 [Helianthus annuus]